MELLAGKAPFNRGKKTTTQIMGELLIGLGVIFLASVIYYFTLGVWYGVKALAMMGVSILVTLLCDVIVASIRFKGDKKAFPTYLFDSIKSNYSLVTAVIFTLTLPIGTSWYVIILGNMFATLLVKYVFGGFGHNIFNPAALARLFVALAFGADLKPFLVNNSIGGLQAGATLTSQYSGSGVKWLADIGNIDLLRVYIGNYNGAIGETFTFLILAVGVVLAIREVINWRTPVFYLGTMALIAIPMALIAKVNVFEAMAVTIGLGGAAFGAIFMLTDPVTSPTSNFGKALIGVIAAFFTVLIRVSGSYPEGMAFSIAFVNIASPMIDKISSGQTTVNLWKKYVSTGAVFVISAGTMSLIAFNNTKGSTTSEPSSSEPPVIEPFERRQGTYTSVTPNEHAEPFSTDVEVGLDLEYNLISLEITGGSTGWNAFNNNKAAIVAYYTSLNVKEFLALQEITELTTGVTAPAGVADLDYVITEAWYSSVALYQAIKDALSGITVYSGSATSALCDINNHCEYDPIEVTLNVDVYVEAGVIKTVGLSDEGQATESYFNNQWKNAKEAVLGAYQGKNASDVKAMTDPVQVYVDGATNVAAGVTYSSTRLFLAVQNALEGYGA